MRTRPLRMRRITWLVSRGWKTITFLEFPTPICVFTIPLRWLYYSFDNLATFSVDYCILYSECPPYFYFRFVWPIDVDSIPHASTPTSIIPTKFEAPTPIRSWVMSDNVSNWLPLKICTVPLRMRQITWPVSRRSKTITFLESPTLICIFTIPLRWLYDGYYWSYLRK